MRVQTQLSVHFRAMRATRLTLMNPFLICILVAIPACLGLKFYAQWSAFRGREERTLEDAFAFYRFKHPMTMETFKRLISVVGACYHVKPGKLRPEDTFDGKLGTLDSWELGAYSEECDRRLKEDFAIELRPTVPLRTVEELLDYCSMLLNQKQSAKHNGPTTQGIKGQAPSDNCIK